MASSRKLRVTMLSSEWRSTKGGLSTINRELAIQLAKQDNVEVSMYLPQCSEEDIKVAQRYNVKLIQARKLIGFEPIEWLSSAPENHQMDFVIGHGLILGRQVQLIQQQHGCKWVQVVHTAPEGLGMFKDYAHAISRGEGKQRAEIGLCESADQVVAIGPKLADEYSCYLRHSQRDQTVFVLTPSIFSEFSQVKQAPKEGTTFRVLVFGRGDNEDFKLKGYDIAAKAISQLNEESYQLIFVGAPPGKEEEVVEKLCQHGIARRQLKVRSFKESREDLARLFCEVDLAIMPSRTEGFGLAALEALSAGLPILVSGNSGLGDALKKVPNGSNRVVNSEDPKEWSKAIKSVRATDRDVRLKESKILCRSYAETYSWEQQCAELVKRMCSSFFAHQIDCKSLTGTGAQTGTSLEVTPQEPQDILQGVREVASASNQQQAVVTASIAGENTTDSSMGTSYSKSERPSSSLATQDPKRCKPADSTAEFLEWSQRQLRSFYNSTAGQVMITPWDSENTLDIDEVYLELSFLRDDRGLGGTTKEPLQDYSEIFEGRGHHQIPKRILVYGNPGIGKSTFAKKLAVDWSRGKKETLKQFDLLLLVKLRDVCNVQDLRSLFSEAELLSGDNSTVFDQLYDYILHNQQKVLLVLDGFDEYSCDKSSPVHQIWRGRHLRECFILVTTRPTTEAELRTPSHAQFELNGFSYEQIKKFAVNFLRCDEKELKEFMNFLWERRLLEMAEVPLLLLMMCLTWKKRGQQGLSSSRANLYGCFLETLSYHLAAKNAGQECTNFDEHKGDLAKFGKVAFDALLENCLYIKVGQLPGDIRKLVEKFIAVGFFQISNDSSSPLPEKVVCFLHKSIQEFLAACYIVQELKTAETTNLTCLSRINSFKDCKRMAEVLKFVCEMSSEGARAVFTHLKVIGEKEDLAECEFSITPSIEDLSKDQREFRTLSLDCLLSCLTSEREALVSVFLDCVHHVVVLDLLLGRHRVATEHIFKSADFREGSYLFLRGSPDNVKSILRDLKTVLVTCYGHTIADVHKYVWVRSPSFQFRGGEFILKKEGHQVILFLCLIEAPGRAWHIELLNALLTSAPESHPKKPGDELLTNRERSRAVCSIENVSDESKNHSLSFVREINFWSPSWKELTFVNNARIIRLSSLEGLVSCIPVTDSLCFFRLCDCETKSAAVISRSLHQTPNLLELDLSFIPVCVSDLAKNLLHVKQLTELQLGGVGMGCHECQLLATSLTCVPELQKLDLSSNPLGHGIIELAEHLSSVPHLTQLRLKSANMGPSEVSALARCLRSISELWSLLLSENPLGQGIIELAEHLSSVPHLAELFLTDTQMDEKGVTAIARALKDLHELRYFDLCENPLGRGVSKLTQCLNSIPQRLSLGLYGVKMTKKEVELVVAVQERDIRVCTDYIDPVIADGRLRMLTESELEEKGIYFDKE